MIYMDEGRDERASDFFIELNVTSFANNLTIVENTDMVNCWWLEGVRLSNCSWFYRIQKVINWIGCCKLLSCV